jgi:hypothetical protein
MVHSSARDSSQTKAQPPAIYFSLHVYILMSFVVAVLLQLLKMVAFEHM